MKPIEVRNIQKSYGGEIAVKNISFEVEKGEIFGLIGPDGAGKTTIFRILTTVLLPDSGSASVAGFSITEEKEIRRRVGYMPGRFSLYQDLSIEENLSFFATIFGTTIEENYELIRDIYVQLEPFKKRLAGQLSGGMKQKLALCCALIHKPEVLFLDEPTTGVDPVSRKEFWEMLKRLKDKGISILVSTPYMDEASLCDRVGLIQNGKLLDIDTPEGVVAKFGQPLWRIVTSNTYQALKVLQKQPSCLRVYPFGEALHYVDKDKNQQGDNLNKVLEENGLEDISIDQTAAQIEDCFIALMDQEPANTTSNANV